MSPEVLIAMTAAVSIIILSKSYLTNTRTERCPHALQCISEISISSPHA